MSGKERRKPYPRMDQAQVPQGRRGKHHRVVDNILTDLDSLPRGQAIRVPLGDLGDTKENLRAALSRAARKRGKQLSTSADQNFLYLWRVSGAD